MSRPQNSPDSDLPSGPLGAAGRDGETGERARLLRRVRRAVEEASAPVSVSQLAERLHATGDGREYGDVHEALYRDHLQRLDATGVLVFDMEMGLVYADDTQREGSRDDCSA
ncbi:hypothetical protein M0R89_20425 (plasmid) [Halorussus limi]|uniref:Uncharacterized protein n=1 Tax=Halorussus limi TaxID=2938695 RepID=A0A8U0I1P5_9EURY|nr:hypothetical protein [Halorussus limi]UPV76836.1 hypothetical protein M0R89_20425 [Halorussus limi]